MTLATLAVLASLWGAHSTSYCLHGRMSDGTYTRAGSAASNRHPLGTRIYLKQSFYGRHKFVVRDRIGWGSELDLWAPTCSTSYAWGARYVSYQLGWPKATGRKERHGHYGKGVVMTWGRHL